VSNHAPGRRSATRRRTRRFDVTTLIAVVLPVLCTLALLAVRPDEAVETPTPPTRTALTRATVVCPTALGSAGGASEVSLTSAAARVSGQVTVGLGKDTEPADIASGRATTVDPGEGPVAVTGQDETAPGLVAARFGGREQAAVTCPAPAAQAWFTGVGAGAGHTSVLELVNPDAGTAIADVTVYGHAGVVDAPRLRGVSVPGGTSVQLDLAELVPRRDELAIQVVASRGRIGSIVLDRRDGVGAPELTQDWLPAQAQPARSNYLMGLVPGAGRRTLVVANGGDDEVRAEVKVVTDDSVFAPEGAPEIRVAPQSVERVTLSDELAKAVADGVDGLVVTSSAPVTATVRSLVAGDLSHAVPSDQVTGSATVLVPDGEKSLVLAGADRAGAVTVVSRSASGDRLASKRVEVSRDRGITVAVPDDAALVTVASRRITLTGAVLGTDGGASVVPLVQPVTSGLIPDVRPGLP
jgi:hypothetical protein